MRKSFKVIIIFISIVLFLGIISICFNFNKIDCSLFQFSIIDAMSLLTSIIIGFGLTYLISVSFSKESKKNEIIEESLSAIKDDFTYLMQQLIKNRNLKIDENCRFYFLVLSKNTDKDIHILQDLCSNNKYMEQSILELLKSRGDFNYIVTGDNLVAGAVITDDFIEKCSEQYYLIKQNIFQCKVQLYK